MILHAEFGGRQVDVPVDCIDEACVYTVVFTAGWRGVGGLSI